MNLVSDETTGRHNIISDFIFTANSPDQPLILCNNWDGVTVFDVSGNEWCDYTAASPELPTRLEPLAAFDYLPLFDPQPDPPAKTMYESAETAYKLEDYDTAKNLYEQVVALYPASDEAKKSLTSLFALEKETTQDYDQLVVYYQTQPNNDYDEKMTKTSDYLVTQSHVEKGDYATAIARLETIIANPSTPEDYVYAVIDLGYVYTRMAEDGTTGALSASGTLPEHRPASEADYRATADNLLAHLIAGTLTSGDDPIVDIPFPCDNTSLPTEFHLAQNYPNPFNPTTTISLQLPAVSRIDLTVYNSAGQLMKNLAAGDWQPGTHEVVWDGKNEAGQPAGSGIYFYRLTTDNGYNEVKSMILLK